MAPRPPISGETKAATGVAPAGIRSDTEARGGVLRTCYTRRSGDVEPPSGDQPFLRRGGQHPGDMLGRRRAPGGDQPVTGAPSIGLGTAPAVTAVTAVTAEASRRFGVAGRRTCAGDGAAGLRRSPPGLTAMPEPSRSIPLPPRFSRRLLPDQSGAPDDSARFRGFAPGSFAPDDAGSVPRHRPARPQPARAERRRSSTGRGDPMGRPVSRPDATRLTPPGRERDRRIGPDDALDGASRGVTTGDPIAVAGARSAAIRAPGLSRVPVLRLGRCKPRPYRAEPGPPRRPTVAGGGPDDVRRPLPMTGGRPVQRSRHAAT